MRLQVIVQAASSAMSSDSLRFDSPSVFGAILDHKKGGFFKIAPVGAATHKQMYFPDTNVLQTRFLSHDGADAEAGGKDDRDGGKASAH